jgi:hypothetical protein
MAAGKSPAREGSVGSIVEAAGAVAQDPRLPGARMSACAARFPTEYKMGAAGRKPDTGARETSFQAPHYWIPGEVLRQ